MISTAVRVPSTTVSAAHGTGPRYRVVQDTSSPSPDFPAITGDCFVLDSELTETAPSLFANSIDFGEMGFNADYLSEGEEIDVIVLDVDQRGRIKLSIKEIPETNEAEKTEHEEQA